MDKKEQIERITKSGCLGEWILTFVYKDGSNKKIAFANKTHMNRAIEVLKGILSQKNTIIELAEENCDDEK